MSTPFVELLIVGAGPVGLMCAYLARRCQISTVVVDQSDGPLEVGRADALNARSLQLLELVDLFDALYPLGKPCNTSSVWANGQFLSRQSSWWDELEGCFHKHFLMLGQSYVEKLLDSLLCEQGVPVKRSTRVAHIECNAHGCLTTLSNGEHIQSDYVIGADGAHSFVRTHFHIPFEVVRPQLIWAVIDGVIDTDFPKVPEIIVFQNETADVAWIPREGEIDRFYVRMDKRTFSFEEALLKINRAMRPHSLTFKKTVWYSKFSVKESVAEQFFVHDRIFLAGDACHIHSVNGGQGLNTGLSDAFNLIWKLNMVLHFNANKTLLQRYEQERKPVAKSVIETSGALVRSTKYSKHHAHAKDYVNMIQMKAGNITGMGIRYGGNGQNGSRLFDCEIIYKNSTTRLYSLLDYTQFVLLIFGELEATLTLPPFVKMIQIDSKHHPTRYWASHSPYSNQAILVRPDAYIASSVSLNQIASLLHNWCGSNDFQWGSEGFCAQKN